MGNAQSTNEERAKDSPTTEAGPDAGPTESEAGAMPSGSEMGHWNTANTRADATRAGTMPRTKSTPMPGETDHAERNQV